MIIDGLILSILLLSALIAFFRGFVREVLTLCGLAGALLAASFLAPLLQPMAHGWFDADPEARYFGLIPQTTAVDVGVFAFVFIITLVVLNLVAHAISHGLHAAGLGAVDRTLGVLFGIARGLFLVMLFYLPFYFKATDEQKANWFKASATLPLLDDLMQEAEPYIPYDFSAKEEEPKDAAEKVKVKEEEADEAPAEEEEPKGFEKLDDLMRSALDEGKEPDIVAPAPKQKGYTKEQSDIIGDVIQKEEKTK